MNVLLVDDEPLARDELAYLLKQNITVETVFKAEGIKEALSFLFKHQIDLVFLDISLNEENGFTLAKELDQLVNPPLIIFATAYDKYAVQAFNIDAIDYILKPFDQERINQALKKASAALSARLTKKKPDTVKETSDTQFITLTSDERTVVIKTQDIIAGTVENGELTIYIKNGSQYVSHETLVWLKSRLNSEFFLQVHRSSIVNVDSIREIQPWFNHTYILIMNNNKRIPVGRSYLKELKARLNM
ncbi:LytR/AlgR family response regulator transcription factor [Liquorilactobacillus oeni]|uniref:Response regulator n=1 Tax=Liquorilactobacillus oeni DSM 19972 TaxID=1423777 RepID=A0A0R1MPV6_9LACO|nr:LytTR family transcriptional regulator DNA-binding domain-containing protein [Liquorilactobacillus oeni]KRL05880.1 response regulator [Liquorilactobacillus oeni DSM 19972]